MRAPLLPLLITIQVAIAFAICVSATYVLVKQVTPILAKDGVRSPDTLLIASYLVPRGRPWPANRLQEAESNVTGIAGVQTTGIATSIPFMVGSNISADVSQVSGQNRTNATIYVGDSLVDSLGLQLIFGRDFSADERSQFLSGVGFGVSGPVIISRHLADRLFPNRSALGSLVHIGDDSAAGVRTVVGVVQNLVSNDLGGGTDSKFKDALIFPGIPSGWPLPVYLARVDHPVDAGGVCRRIVDVLEDSFRGDLVQGIEPRCETYSAMRDRALTSRHAAAWLLSGITGVVLLVALMGVGGLTSYWVQLRRRQTGLRRALGATRADILSLFLLESALIVGTGIVAGGIFTYVGGTWITRHLSLARTPFSYLLAGAVVMLIVCQLSALKSALRASRVAPIAALRQID